MTEYRVDVQNPDDAERLVTWLNRTRSLKADMPIDGDTIVGFNQAAFDWLADQDEGAGFRITYRRFLGSVLSVENEDEFVVQRVAS